MTSRVLLAVGAALAAAATVAPGASAGPVSAGDRYVALGSSYAAGPGLPDQVDQACARSGQNYPHRVAAAAGLDLVDVSCSGATTADILERSQRPPSGGRTVPPQIDAVTPDARLVTVTIGGNDLDLVGSMITGSGCFVAAGAVPQVCDRLDAATRPGPGALGNVERSIGAVVGAVRARAPRATVMLVQYLPVLPADGTPCAATPLTPAQAARTRQTYDGLIAATERAARTTGATVIDVPEADRHTACDPDPWMSGFRNPLAGQGDPLAVGSSYHPNQAGTNAVAQRVGAELRG